MCEPEEQKKSCHTPPKREEKESVQRKSLPPAVYIAIVVFPTLITQTVGICRRGAAPVGVFQSRYLVNHIGARAATAFI